MTRSKIAITGGIGSGKSAVSEILRKKGYPVLSCDEIYAQLCGEREFLEKLSKLFPDSVQDRKLNRRALSQTVFADTAALEKLNAFTHPLIMERLQEKMAAYPLSFAEVPLLFEGGFETLFDGVIVVMRENAARVSAVRARDSLSEEEILLRMSRQFDYKKLPQNCFVIENNGSLVELEKQTEEVIKFIL